MKAYETSAKVGADGQVHLAGLPFAPGTDVNVAITPQANGSQSPAPDRVVRLFAALDKARNVKPVGRLKRNELYPRDILR